MSDKGKKKTARKSRFVNRVAGGLCKVSLSALLLESGGLFLCGFGLRQTLLKLVHTPCCINKDLLASVERV